ncbi:hypothetical protein AB3S75_040296 [Citrus x aurantiifolia]
MAPKTGKAKPHKATQSQGREGEKGRERSLNFRSVGAGYVDYEWFSSGGAGRDGGAGDGIVLHFFQNL